MVGQKVSAGPFVGGLNTLSDPGAIADQELVICQNFEVDPDGALRSRPPFVDRSVTMSLGTTGNIHILGRYFTGDGTLRIIGTNEQGTFVYSGSTWTQIASTFAASAVAQFNGVLYLLAPPTSANPGGYWNGTTFTPDSTMPKGYSILGYKSRLWVATTNSTVQYSSVTPDSNFWTVGSTFGGTFKVGGGDGQQNVALLLAFGSLLIFRTESIWQFTYSTDPAFGSQSVLVDKIGLASAEALQIFENVVYFIYNGKAYTLNGANASQLNQTVPFISGGRAGCYLPFAVSVVDRRVIFTYYDIAYVFNLRSRTWTAWTTPAYGGIGRVVLVTGADTADQSVYIAHSNFAVASGGSRVARTLYFTDGYTTEVETAPYTAALRTKTYDYATPDHFKRLFWWGMDGIFRTALTAAVVPVIYAGQVTWGQLLSKTWGQLLNYTWGQPSVGAFDATTTVSGAQAGTGPLRKFVKLPKSLRFQRAYFQISISVDGSTTTSPAKVFGLETIVDIKQTVSRQVS